MHPLRDESARLTNTGKTTIAAYFRNPAEAEQAIADLSAAGFPKKDIGVALRDHTPEQAKTNSAETGWAQRLRSMFTAQERDEYESDDAIDVLDHMGIPEDEGRYYRNALQHGGVLLTVETRARRAEAMAILSRHQAITGENWRTQPAFAERAGAGTNKISAGERRRLELLGETLRINKERVQTGSVTLRKDVVTEKQNVEVPVTREELVIERHAAEGNTPARGTLGGNEEIHVPLSEERVNVEKRPVVREEVEVGKRQVQDTKTVTDDVKHEELRVEREGDVKLERDKKRRTA
jgi:uncharacterized protein (TIGR02271 family)